MHYWFHDVVMCLPHKKIFREVGSKIITMFSPPQ